MRVTPQWYVKSNQNAYLLNASPGTHETRLRDWKRWFMKPFASYFLQKDEKRPPPIVGALSTMPVKKYKLGILNPVTSSQEKYLSSMQVSVKLVQAVTGGGGFSNSYHLWTLSEEWCDGKKSQDVNYQSRLKGLVINIQGTDKRLILHAKITGAWMSVCGTTVSGTVLYATEFRYFYVLVITSLL